MDMTKCSETLFTGKAKVVDKYCINFKKNKAVADFLPYLNCLLVDFRKMGHTCTIHIYTTICDSTCEKGPIM